jgi:hypothetical protein
MFMILKNLYKGDIFQEFHRGILVLFYIFEQIIPFVYLNIYH